MDDAIGILLVIGIAVCVAALIFIAARRKVHKPEETFGDDVGGIRMPEKKEKPEKPDKTTDKTTYVTIYRLGKPDRRVICRCCECENWPEARFCDVCGQPL